MRRRRIARFGLTALILSTAACSAIAGLDGDFELDTAPNIPDGSKGIDGNTGDGGVDGPTTDGTTDGQTGTDAGGDTGPDAPVCTFKTDASDINSIGAPVANCPASGWVLCWDFAPDYSPPNYKWDLSTATAEGSSYEVTDAAVGAPARNLHVVIADAATPGTSESLTIYDWNSTQAGIQAFNFVNDSAIQIAVSFNLKRADRAANIITFGFRNKEIGLAVYPNPCGGPARVGPAGQDPATYPAGANVLLDHWYRGEIKLSRVADHWNATFSMGGVVIGASTDPFPVETSTVLDASITTGLFKVANGATSEISIDDVRIDVVTP